MGIIDPHSEYSLYDVIDGTLGFEDNQPAGSVDFYGFHIGPVAPDGSKYQVAYEGHAGTVLEFSPEDYDDVLELVDDLVHLLIESHHYDYQDDREGLVEWAGPFVTHDQERAQENPKEYVYVPDDAFERE